MRKSVASFGRMNTSKLAVSGRRPKTGARQRIRPLLMDGDKLTVALTGEELMLARSLARVIAMPGQTLNAQDVLRVALANLGLANKKKLAVGTDRR